MIAFDGPTLRAVRESTGVPLRRIAKQSGMSHGHLSKVERGEYGRPVTPAIMAAYQRVTGVDLVRAAKAATERTEGPTARRVRSWRPGELTDLRRRGFNAAMAALAIGGLLGEPFGRLLDATGRPLTPLPPEVADVEQMERLAELVTALELRYGGGLVSQLSKCVLRWAVPMLDAVGVQESVARRLHAAVAGLAHRAAWAAFDVAAHESARALFRLALFVAARSGEADLRAQVLIDAAAQHNRLGYHRDALEMIRLVEGDERLAAGTRMLVYGAKARAYAAVGEADACRRAVERAEQAHTEADPRHPGWVATLADPALLWAVTGHAMAAVAHGTGEPVDRAEALKRLGQAADGFDAGHARASALCAGRLALLHVQVGDAAEATAWIGRLRERVVGVGSARVDRTMVAVRRAAAAHPDSEVNGVAELLDDQDGG